MTPSAGSYSISTTPPTWFARSPEDQLFFRLRRRGDIVVLSVRGEADAYTLALWRQRVREAAETARAAGGALIVDATTLDFMSLRTLAALAEDAAAYHREGVELCLVTTNLRIARLACSDSRTARLTIRSTVVSALTAFELRRRPGLATARPYRAPQITDEPGAEQLRHLGSSRRHGSGSPR
ncbi:STAS domain-containing protein [Nocardia wallacei]|uniref:STAS domain-containing protein n=1 Tax=Nocardia wallacei TaxID=480035 RepID=UPI002455C11E|nr:STAS domain-containing protein [Nocardia wallacei]